MPISPRITDDYLAELAGDDRKLADREAAALRKREEANTELGAVAAERQALKVAAERYRAHLEKKGAAVPQMPLFGTSAVAHEQKDDGEQQTLRMGPKRRLVWETIAQNGVNGRPSYAAKIRSATGLSTTLVTNVLWSDCKSGYLERRGEEIYMTKKGFDFLQKVKAAYGATFLQSPSTFSEGASKETH